MNEWNYFAAGMLVMIGVIAGYVILRLHRRSRTQEMRLKIQKQDIADLTQQVIEQGEQISELTRRVDIINGASKQGKEHWQWNTKAGTEHMALLLVQKVEEEEASLALTKTILGTALEVRKGTYDPDKPERDYGKKEDKL